MIRGEIVNLDNEGLKALYEKIYAEGKENFFTFSTADISREVVSELDWKGLRALEIGCGTGETAYLIAELGAKEILAFDYSEQAIIEAKERYNLKNLVFRVGSFEDIEGSYDCIVMQEVIEHTDDPFAVLSLLSRKIHEGGHLIVTCPSFVNVRGIIWMALQILFQVPMSLSDKQFILPADMIRWGNELGMSLQWRTFRHSQAQGDLMLVDMKKRLTNALRDAGMDNSKVDDLLAWFKDANQFQKDDYYNGAAALYHFVKHNINEPIKK